MPLVIIFFKQISWVSPISNLVAIPLISLLVVPLEVLAAFTFYLFRTAEQPFVSVGGLGAGIFIGHTQCTGCTTPD